VKSRHAQSGSGLFAEKLFENARQLAIGVSIAKNKPAFHWRALKHWIAVSFNDNNKNQ
jgi:hypothetical protein